eukprot:scaffold9783_cov127-Isochrysis_galbana.AAC.7
MRWASLAAGPDGGAASRESGRLYCFGIVWSGRCLGPGPPVATASEKRDTTLVSACGGARGPLGTRLGAAAAALCAACASCFVLCDTGCDVVDAMYDVHCTYTRVFVHVLRVKQRKRRKARE